MRIAACRACEDRKNGWPAYRQYLVGSL